MALKGRAHKFGDNINTDYIISGKHKFKTLDINELTRHLMEDLDPDFFQKIKPGDFIVAGSNFGCGSSREQAPLVIKEAQIAAVLAKSFARIFYRNSINIGLPVLECNTDKISAGDELEIDMDKGIIRSLSRNEEFPFLPFPPFVLKILNEGGLVEHFRRHGNFFLGE
jgi:3-isopropylmalate/(R)-2-methylmalate dehydratase small subunit